MFFPLALPFKVCECDVFMAVLPVHTIAPCFHLVYEVLSACGCFSAVHDRKGCILAEYGAKWAKEDGFPEMAEEMEKRVGISKGIEKIIEPQAPKRSHYHDGPSL